MKNMFYHRQKISCTSPYARWIHAWVLDYYKKNPVVSKDSILVSEPGTKNFINIPASNNKYFKFEYGTVEIMNLSFEQYINSMSKNQHPMGYAQPIYPHGEDPNILTIYYYNMDETGKQKFIDMVKKSYKNINGVRYFTQRVSDYSRRQEWRENSHKFRNPNSIFLPNVSSQIIKNAKNFISNEEWYRTNGLNYKHSLLISGPSGTGKTSFICYLACLIDFDVYQLNFENMDIDQFNEALSSVPERAILLIEDIDHFTEPMVKDDTLMQQKKSNPVLLSNILNVIDGFNTPNNVIFLFTANDTSKLSSAFLRSSRIDHHYKFDYATEKQLNDMVKYYRPTVDATSYITKWMSNSNTIVTADLFNIISKTTDLNDDEFIQELNIAINQ